MIGPYGPLRVVQVEAGDGREKVHVCLVVGIQGSHVSPVGLLSRRGRGEFICQELSILHHGRKDILPEIVLGLAGSVPDEFLEENACVEDVDAHRGIASIVLSRNRDGLFRLFLKPLHPSALSDVHNAQLPAVLFRPLHDPDREVRSFPNVEFEHPGIVHLVDVVSGEDEHEVRVLLLEGIEVLIDGIRCSTVPVFADSLLGRDDVDVLVQFGMEHVPSHLDVMGERLRLVLRQDMDPAYAGVEAVGESEIDDSIDASEGDGRLRPHIGEGTKPFPFAARHDQCGESLHWVCHGRSPFATCVRSIESSQGPSGPHSCLRRRGDSRSPGACGGFCGTPRSRRAEGFETPSPDEDDRCVVTFLLQAPDQAVRRFLVEITGQVQTCTIPLPFDRDLKVGCHDLSLFFRVHRRKVDSVSS